MVLVQLAAATSTVLPTGGRHALPRLASLRPGHIIDLLVGLAFGVQPALDDLDAVQVGADGVAQGVDHEGRRALPVRGRRSPPIGTPFS